MSEQNILNPTLTSLLGPDYGYGEQLPETRSLVQAASGKAYTRREFGLGRTYDLPWNTRDLATKHALQQWAQQYENDFFTLADYERGRYFSGRFTAPLKFQPAGNNAYNITGQFAELPGLPMFQYPSNWTRDAIFLEEKNGFGEDQVKLLTPANWTLESVANDHGGQAYSTATTNETAEWLYFGYGCRFWARKQNNLGIVELTYTRQRDGAVMAGPTNVDLYNAAALAAAVLDTQTNFPLDTYRVKARCTGTRNASSSANTVLADAIEVMQ